MIIIIILFYFYFRLKSITFPHIFFFNYIRLCYILYVTTLLLNLVISITKYLDVLLLVT
jgi:hypothetical protein